MLTLQSLEEPQRKRTRLREEIDVSDNEPTAKHIKLCNTGRSGRQDLTYHTFEELVPDNVESPRPSVDFY